MTNYIYEVKCALINLQYTLKSRVSLISGGSLLNSCAEVSWNVPTNRRTFEVVAAIDLRLYLPTLHFLKLNSLASSYCATL